MYPIRFELHELRMFYRSLPESAQDKIRSKVDALPNGARVKGAVWRKTEDGYELKINADVPRSWRPTDGWGP
jgi:hypothetical protein